MIMIMIMMIMIMMMMIYDNDEHVDAVFDDVVYL